MSSLIVEVCEVSNVEPHPKADRLAIATVKGWKTCIAIDSETKEPVFKIGDKCIYFPPDSILPVELAHGPEDDPPGRLGIMKYLAALPKNNNGIRPLGGRVKATRLRGEASFGVIMHIDPSMGDNPDWEVGTDVTEHFGITKWEPPMESMPEGEVAPHNDLFRKYTDMENWRNFQNEFQPGEEVVITEKLHGSTNRQGIIFTQNPGESEWEFMAGSHELNRREFFKKYQYFNIKDLIEKLILKSDNLSVGDILDTKDGQFWKVIEKTTKDSIRWWEFWRYIFKLGKEEIKSIQTIQVYEDGSDYLYQSKYWATFSSENKKLLEHIRDYFDINEQKYSIIIFGELYGAGIQKGMSYGLSQPEFRAFDISINGKFLDYDTKKELLDTFNVKMVPVLYVGPYSHEIVEKFTDGPTTLTDTKKLSGFKGREGIVITPKKERYSETLNGRLILKSISADYLSRNDISDSH